MTRLTKILRDALFLGAFLILGSLIIAKIDLSDDSVIPGPFFAIDGDTLAAGAERLRLIGIDAPEADQTCGEGTSIWPCGETAREALSDLASRHQARCSGSDRDRYGRVLVRCEADGVNINAALVRRGMAVASGNYDGDEASARAEARGIWAGPFERPGAWRAARGADADDGAADDRTVLDPLRDWLEGLF